MGTLVFILVIAFTLIMILSAIAATWYDGWRDFLRSL